MGMATEMPWDEKPDTDPDDPTAPCRACSHGPDICYQPDSLCGGDPGTEGYPGWERARWECDGCGIMYLASEFCLWTEAPCCDVDGLTFCFECMAKAGQVLVARMATLERIDDQGTWQTTDVDGETRTIREANPIRALLALVPAPEPEPPVARWPGTMKLLPDE